MLIFACVLVLHGEVEVDRCTERWSGCAVLLYVATMCIREVDKGSGAKISCVLMLGSLQNYPPKRSFKLLPYMS